MLITKEGQMTREKMLEYGEFSFQLEKINNIDLPVREIKKHLQKARNDLYYWQDVMKQKAAGVDPEELKHNLIKQIDNFSFN